jgi:hypothetical protein
LQQMLCRRPFWKSSENHSSSRLTDKSTGVTVIEQQFTPRGSAGSIRVALHGLDVCYVPDVPRRNRCTVQGPDRSGSAPCISSFSTPWVGSSSAVARDMAPSHVDSTPSEIFVTDCAPRPDRAATTTATLSAA